MIPFLTVTSSLLLLWAFILVVQRRSLRQRLSFQEWSAKYWFEAAMAMGKEVVRLRAELDSESMGES